MPAVVLAAAVVLAGSFLVTLLIAAVVAVVLVFVLRAVGIPEPLPWLIGLLVFLLLLL